MFGLSPDDIEECDLPAADEPLGVMLTEEADIAEFVEAVKEYRNESRAK